MCSKYPLVSWATRCSSLLLLAATLRADAISDSNSATTLLLDQGTLVLDGYNNTAMFSGLQYNSTNLQFTLGTTPIPVGSSLISATLTLSGAGSGTPAVDAAIESEQVAEYISGYNPVYSWEVVGSYECGFFSTCYNYGWVQTGDTPIYSSGTPGSASFSSQSSSVFSVLQIGTTTLALPSSGGTVDLLSLGLGPDLLAGDPLSVNGTSTLNLSYTDSTGYDASVTYSAFVASTPDLSGSLDITYSTASAPEPASFFLAILGLATVVLSVRVFRLCARR